MIELKIKLYGLLRQRYKLVTAYDAENGIGIILDSGRTILQLCEGMEIDPADVNYAVINGKRTTDLNTFLKDEDEIGLYPQPPMGG